MLRRHLWMAPYNSIIRELETINDFPVLQGSYRVDTNQLQAIYELQIAVASYLLYVSEVKF